MLTRCDIALVISDLGSGGAQKVLVQLAEAWHRSGKHVAVITLAEEELDFHKLAEGVSRIVVGGRRDFSKSLWWAPGQRDANLALAQGLADY